MSLFYEEATCKSSTKKGLLYAPDPEEREKGMLSDQPQLLCITSTALLCRWGRQSLKDMTSLRTDFETHAIWQGYVEEPTAKNFVARKACTITLSKVQRTHWNVIKCKLHLRIIQKLSYNFWTIPKLYDSSWTIPKCNLHLITFQWVL